MELMHVPKPMLDVDQWHLWRSLGGNKMPYMIDGITPAKSNDPETWVSFYEATKALSRDSRLQDHRLAFTLGVKGNRKYPFVGIDLDDCLDDNGDFYPWAVEILAKFRDVAYAEVSPSHRGIKLLCLGQKPEGARNRVSMGEGKCGIEVYDDRRFWTFTGEMIQDPDMSFTEIQDAREQIEWLYEEWFNRDPEPEVKSAPVSVDGTFLSRRVEAYLKKILEDPIAGEGDRNNKLFRIAGHVAAFGVSEAEVFAAARLVNEFAFEPSLDQRELEKVVRSAMTNGTPREFKETSPLATGGNAGSAPKSKKTKKKESRFKPRIIVMSDVEQKPINWLWRDYFPLGALSLVAGLQGIGKSFLTIDMAARVSNGSPWPDGSENVAGNVLLMGGEDPLDQVVAPRLSRHGANMKRVRSVTGAYREDSEFDLAISLDDVDLIEQAMEQCNPRLVVIDPIGSFIGGRVDSYRDNEVRSVLTPLQAMAEKHEAAIVLVAHHGKAFNVRCADDLILGSRAFAALSRTTRHVFKEEDGRRLFLPGKNNLAADSKAMAFELEVDEDRDKPPRLAWEPSEFHLTSDEHLAQRQESPRSETALDKTMKWLEKYLEENAPVHKEQVMEDAEIMSHSIRTVERAAKELGVHRTRDGMRGKAVWQLAEDE